MSIFNDEVVIEVYRLDETSYQLDTFKPLLRMDPGRIHRHSTISPRARAEWTDFRACSAGWPVSRVWATFHPAFLNTINCTC